MNRTSLRRALVPGAAALAIALSGCAAANDTGASTSESDLAGNLAGGGASSQEAAQAAWMAGFSLAHPDVTVTYDPIGSGGGRENFISGAFPFAGSDAYLTDDEGELSAATERCNGTAPIEIPDYVSPIAVIYNLEGVDDLQLSPQTLAGIFAGTITSWDDKAIAADNPGVDLPKAPINAVHRSDESGTTENFTDYLDAVAPKVWTEGPLEVWPEQYGGEGAQGTSGVVSAVKEGTNSIGYADASQAQGLGVAKIKVGGDYVAPTDTAAARILEVSPRVEGRDANSVVFDLDHQTDEAGTYPIVLVSYLLACDNYDSDDAEAGKLTKAYLEYVLSDEGQQQGAEEAGSAPLAEGLRKEVTAIVDGITVD
ncbi:phosphate ABC transporter substrate-binding protein PstS [Nocardioides sp. dk4132]|uniref:phosphate ABC transporter substrate-binding protein PstS n=1 Tax=unclassified Nocardioides TaxID=2615069 RepID=UPI0012960002|nr:MULTISPECIES: phosphate ABC transporter substrate-binding protein PstS [unclassified Nocardioides]MQW77980.1 phosphate ABC transporter substrate-binding protein PstS [Nocardioides sp. dk4132]QGA09098.1 phosphate ABC transporter substrate-binding protein PstS [Nocardioides sp. dk884]